MASRAPRQMTIPITLNTGRVVHQWLVTSTCIEDSPHHQGLRDGGASARQWPIREILVAGTAMATIIVLSTRRWWLDSSSSRPPEDIATQLKRLVEVCAASADRRVRLRAAGLGGMWAATVRHRQPARCAVHPGG